MDSLNGKACATSLTYKSRSKVTTTGSWRSGQEAGSYEYILSTTFPASRLTSSGVSATFTPFLPEAGNYDVYFYGPACTNDCNQRTQVDLTVHFSANQSQTTYVDLTTGKSIYSQIYSGPIEATTVDFQPYVTLAVAHNATGPKNGTVTIAAQAIQFVKNASNTTLTSILEFVPDSDAQTTAANTTLKGTYGPLAGKF